MKTFFTSKLRFGGLAGSAKSAVGGLAMAKVAMLIGTLLIIAIAIQAAFFTLRLITPTAVAPLVVASAGSSATAASPLRIEAVRGLNLFGEYGARPTQQAQRIEAPETTLNVRLVGVTASSNPSLSAAIVQQGNNQVVYIIGETISGSRAVVREIHADRILIENGGRMETVYLEGRDGFTPEFSRTQATSSRTSGAVPAQAPRELTASPEVMIDNVMELINITPASNDGELIGYRLSPKSNPEIFRAAGLRDGDIAIMLNGYDLTNAAEAMSLVQSLESMTTASIVVLRDGEEVTIELSIPNQ
ncbi:MAG: type II secretion system protein GspC [Aliidiomarina sp.]|uniref:type II secretion system protein GspC n=1 Tax=Aliidiomarina sp. TaxID=1872439 RepID=UPI0025BFBE4D|nr:type II secretion system protein GspC [Aliidiomarina sp.]MCH8502287.1 type II secretion system protein GspC [Aliidiomarina sp.]